MGRFGLFHGGGNPVRPEAAGNSSRAARSNPQVFRGTFLFVGREDGGWRELLRLKRVWPLHSRKAKTPRGRALPFFFVKRNARSQKDSWAKMIKASCATVQGISVHLWGVGSQSRLGRRSSSGLRFGPNMDGVDRAGAMVRA